MRPSRFHVRPLDRIDGIRVWRVDGHAIRDRLDVEFTNGHHHFSRPYVPRGEIWLDREAPGANEWPLWAMRQILERRRMLRGDDYLAALRSASYHERAERRRARGLPIRLDPGECAGVARRAHLGRMAGREVWLVDGRAVRDLAYVDFTLGGHGYRYRFIPKGEIWIDDAVSPAERPAILHHEVVEVEHMTRGRLRYHDAHALASVAETAFRARPRRISL